MARPELAPIQAGIESWDAAITENFNKLVNSPLPVAEYDKNTALPNPALFDRCVVFKQQQDDSWSFQYSDGTSWTNLTLTGSEISTLLYQEDDTNKLTDVMKAKLDFINVTALADLDTLAGASQNIRQTEGLIEIDSVEGTVLDVSSTNVTTGALVFTLPTAWTGSMVTLEVEILEYFKVSRVIRIQGNDALSQLWGGGEATVLAGDPMQVRLGQDGTNTCLVIGDTTSTWSYASARIKNLTVRRAGATLENWDKPWTTSVKTSLTNYVFSYDTRALPPVQNIRQTGNTLEIASVEGGVLDVSTTYATTGALVATLPNSWTATMVSFEVEILEWDKPSRLLKIEGYDRVSSWEDYANATVINGGSLRVRLGHDGTNTCLVLGDTTSTWSYTTVRILNFTARFGGATLENWNKPWTISAKTSLTGYTFTFDKFASSPIHTNSEMVSRTITMSPSDTVTQLQEKISNIGRYIHTDVTITVYFPDGTYNNGASSLYVGGFFGGGTLDIVGNPNENATNVAMSVKVTSSVHTFRVEDCRCRVLVRSLEASSTGTGGFGLHIRECKAPIWLLYSSFKSAVSDAVYLWQSDIHADQCVFDNENNALRGCVLDRNSTGTFGTCTFEGAVGLLVSQGYANHSNSTFNTTVSNSTKYGVTL